MSDRCLCFFFFDDLFFFLEDEDRLCLCFFRLLRLSTLESLSLMSESLSEESISLSSSLDSALCLRRLGRSGVGDRRRGSGEGAHTVFVLSSRTRARLE